MRHLVREQRHALAADLERIARAAGVDIVGFGDVCDALPADFKHLPVGISLGVVFPSMARFGRGGEARSDDEVEQAAVCDHPDLEGQRTLDRSLRWLADELRKRGYRYFSCPPECDPMESPFRHLMVRRFSHKAAATCAGLGWVGKHGLVYHPVYGSQVTWATLVTNAPLNTAAPVTECGCGDCRLCVDACPSGAITGRAWRREDGMVSLVDVERCRQVLDDNERSTGHRICGRCAIACAVGKFQSHGC